MPTQSLRAVLIPMMVFAVACNPVKPDEKPVQRTEAEILADALGLRANAECERYFTCMPFIAATWFKHWATQQECVGDKVKRWAEATSDGTRTLPGKMETCAQ